MYELKDKNARKTTNKRRMVNTAKECAYLAVFIALVIAAQLVFAAVPGVELVTVLFVSYAFVFGWKRGLLAATAFSILRQFVFGFYPVVLILYLTHFNFLSFIFGVLGEKFGKKMHSKIDKSTIIILFLLVIIAAAATAGFSLFDNILTPLWYGYSERARKIYFYASLPFMIPQVICAAVSVSVLFLPLHVAFTYIKRGLRH